MIIETPGRRAAKTVFLLVAVPLFACLSLGKADDVIWLDKPATNWEKEAFPLGNGRLGCMVFGGVEEERIQYNVDSLWTGDENLEGNYRAPGMGFYQNFGNLYVSFDAEGPAAEYRRELNIGKAVCRVTYQQDGIKFARATFCSHPDQVIVIPISRKSAITGRIT
jgi:alpha-L-fucosidase 2